MYTVVSTDYLETTGSLDLADVQTGPTYLRRCKHGRLTEHVRYLLQCAADNLKGVLANNMNSAIDCEIEKLRTRLKQLFVGCNVSVLLVDTVSFDGDSNVGRFPKLKVMVTDGEMEKTYEFDVEFSFIIDWIERDECVDTYNLLSN